MINPAARNSKELLISALSEKWPQTLKELFSNVKKNYGKNITYQAVHKALRLLLKEKIVIHENSAYKLDLSWIKQNKIFFEIIERKYEQIVSKPSSIPSKIEFNTYFEMYSFTCDALYEEMIDPKSLPICFYDAHWWNTFMFTEEQIKKMEAFTKKHQFYCVAKPGGPADQMFMNFFKNYGMHCTNSKKVETEHGFFVIGDCFVQIFYPEEIIKFRNEIAEQSITLKNIDINKMQRELVLHKNKIIFLINQDKELAQRMREKVLSYFKEAK